MLQQFNNESSVVDPARNFDIAVGIFRAFISPVISIVGIIGNIIIILIFCRGIKPSRFSVYCITLAIIHIIVLFMNSFLDDFLGRGLTYATHYSHLMTKIDLLSDVSCKVMEYLPNTMYLLSSLLIIIFSIDRLLTIYKPIAYFSGYYIKLAVLACFACFVISLTINIPLLISYGLQIDKYHSLLGWEYKCELLINKPGIHILGEFALNVKVIGAFIVPTFIVLILNTIIFYKMWRLHKSRLTLIKPTCPRLSLTSLSSKDLSICSANKSDAEISRIFGHVAFNTAFLFLNFPLVIVMILRLYNIHIDLTHRKDLYYENALKHLSRLFSSVKDISYAVNFFVYLKFLPNFYKGLINILNNGCSCLLPIDLQKNDTVKRNTSNRKVSWNKGIDKTKNLKVKEKLTKKLYQMNISSKDYYKPTYQNKF